MRIQTVTLFVLLGVLLGACGDGSGPEAETEETADLAGLTDEVLDSEPVGTQLIGKVTDPDGAPVAGAIVTVGASSTLTATDGFFDLEVLGPDVLQITKSGWTTSEIEWDGSQDFVRTTLERLRIRAIRVGGEGIRDDATFEGLLVLADDTAINAFVFDTKQEDGKVLYDTGVEEAHDIGAVAATYDPDERISQAREHGLYVITRIVVFNDPFRASAVPGQRLTEDWTDPTNSESWEYPLALAVEACELGFDEIQFDYVRFPSGVVGEGSGQLNLSEDERVAAISAFLEEAKSRITPMGCVMSADVFGIIVSRPGDQGIGQRPEELSQHVDVFSPMVYPSHYSDGWLGLADPNEHPYDVTADAIDDAFPRLEPGTELRPWLQAFFWTDQQIRRSIQAAEDRDVGWILWNSVSNYSRDAIPTDAELAVSP